MRKDVKSERVLVRMTPDMLFELDKERKPGGCLSVEGRWRRSRGEVLRWLLAEELRCDKLRQKKVG